MQFHETNQESVTHIPILSYKRKTKNAKKDEIDVSEKTQVGILRSAFNQYELTQHPKLVDAISVVEKHQYIKRRLTTGPVGLRYEELTAKIKGINPKGYTRLGLDQLPVLPMDDITNHSFGQKKLPALELLEDLNDREQIPDFKNYLKNIIADFQNIKWLKSEYSEMLANVFMSTFSTTFHSVSKLMHIGFSVTENKMLGIRILEHIQQIKKEILEVLHKKYQYMLRVGLFSEQSNGERIVSIFRTFLNRRMVASEIMEYALISVKRGHRKGAMIMHQYPESGLDEMILTMNSHKKAKKLVIDEIVLKQNAISKALLNPITNVNSELKNRFNRQKIIALPRARPEDVQRHIAIQNDLFELVYGKLDDDEIPPSMWSEIDRDQQSVAAENLLNYKHNELKHISLNVEDPVLQAHSILNERKLPEVLHISSLNKVPERLLPESTQDRFKFDFDEIFNEEDEDEWEDDELEAKNEKHINIRALKSTVPPPIPKDTILENEKPVASRLSLLADNSNSLDFIDANLNRFKEVEELYNKIMDSIQSSKLDKEDEIDTVYACPTAPVETPIAELLFVNPAIALRKRTRMNLSASSQGSGQSNGTPIRVIKTPARKNISTREFRRNKKAAMRKVQSSKYGFRYNFGGYIPGLVYRHKALKKLISSDNYNLSIGDTYSDFLPMLVYNERVTQHENARMVTSADEERKLLEFNEEKEKKLKEIKMSEIFQPPAGKWHPKVLEYMEDYEIKLDENKAVIPDITPEEQEQADERIAQLLLGKVQEIEEQPAPDESENAVIEPETAASKEVEFLGQSKMEMVWARLKMPLDQKLDMAVKYGHHTFKKLDSALVLWDLASQLIDQREIILSNIEEFEVSCSDPRRFFTNNSLGRLEEEKKRLQLSNHLHSLDDKIRQLIQKINDELQETVTYNGIPYAEKMKTDYSEILRRATVQRPKEGSK